MLRFYTIAKFLLITKQIEIINKKKFAKIIFNKNIKTFVIYMTFFNLSSILIYLAKKD